MRDDEEKALLEGHQDDMPLKEALSLPTHQPRISRRAILLRILALVGLIGLSLHAVRGILRRRDTTFQRVRVAANPDSRGHLTVPQAERRFLEVPNPESAISTSKSYSSIPHLAGSPRDFETAKQFLDLLQAELLIPKPDEIPVYDAGSSQSQEATRSITERTHPVAWIDKYYPVLNTPLGRALDILGDDGTPVWMANVEEVEDLEDPAGGYARAVGAWHGLSKDGDVSGKLIYANYGRKADFDGLASSGANLTGKIAIVRYGGVFRGLKVKAAQEAGAIGCLIYSDPRDDGTVTVQNGYLPYPHGPARNPTSVQRGSVQFLSIYPGDPTTPGYPAYPNATRLEGTNIPSIPSLPISWYNAKRLLEEIWGDYDTQGDKWDWELDGKSSKRDIRLLNQVRTDITPIWNVMGVIPGHIRNEIVVVGNHRDAWVMGAGDPTSGTVAVTEIIKGFGTLLRAGWKPLRTIVFASWDAEEYGLVGSTEWGEDFADWLQEHVVAYLNADTAVSGSTLRLRGSPSLAHLIRGVAQDLPHPTDLNRTLWDARRDNGKFPLVDKEKDVKLAVEESTIHESESTGVKPLGSGSDYTVFLQRLGIASIDGGFGSGRTDAVYHYHSVYDSHRYQELYADPGFHRHVAVAKYLGLVTLRVADSLILPINTTKYALELGSYLAKVEALAESQGLSLDFTKLNHSIIGLQHASAQLDKERVAVEKFFRKQFRKLGTKRRAHHHRHHRHHLHFHKQGKKCAKRGWKKIRNWVKGAFGVPSRKDYVRDESVHERHDFPPFRVGLAGGREEVHKKRDFPKIRLDLASGKIHKREADVSGHEEEIRAMAEVEEARVERRDFPKVRIGFAGGKNNMERSEDIEARENEQRFRVGVATSKADGVSNSKQRDTSDGEQQRDGAVVRQINGQWPCHKDKGSRDAAIMALAFEAEGHKSRLPKKFLKARKRIASVNSRLRLFEQGFISEKGIKDREWYKHLGVAPGKWLGYGATTFPALSEALDEKNLTLAIYEVERLVEIVNGLTGALVFH
ncbi:uncharacterized protein EI90DRAFT_2988837 [Cantharellus anzutake]|uniref:uncharacterized protein n=1 Tax=Cantharellus anzutake TaxID=1750568 RepID=UPI0019040B4E|nr:uncharacterized protein EI90DRAFT_2988837 [Cantharellus anzutake]KAF8342316.1 hypothetical protein EI90DRAFT_2988837 [Cantharellus anzutake]